MIDIFEHRVTVFCFALCVGFTTHVQAQGSFTDSFENPIGPDRQPVSWAPRTGSEIFVANGVMALTGPPGDLAGAFVPDYSATDVVVDTEFEVIQGTDIGVVLRIHPTDSSQCYFANYVRRSDDILIGQGCIAPTSLVSTDVPFATDDTPLRMRFQAIDDELKLWFWPANEVRPEDPVVRTINRDVRGPGSVGFFVNETVATATPPRVEIREFSVTVVPEPSSGLIAWIAVLPLVSRLRR